MGKIKYRGIDSLIGDVHDLAELPDTVIAEMLEAEADVLVAAQQRAAIKRGKVLMRPGKRHGQSKREG